MWCFQFAFLHFAVPILQASLRVAEHGEWFLKTHGGWGVRVTRANVVRSLHQDVGSGLQVVLMAAGRMNINPSWSSPSWQSSVVSVLRTWSCESVRNEGSCCFVDRLHFCSYVLPHLPFAVMLCGLTLLLFIAFLRRVCQHPQARSSQGDSIPAALFVPFLTMNYLTQSIFALVVVRAYVLLLELIWRVLQIDQVHAPGSWWPIRCPHAKRFQKWFSLILPSVWVRLEFRT